jgi:hypothetical protein
MLKTKERSGDTGHKAQYISTIQTAACRCIILHPFPIHRCSSIQPPIPVRGYIQAGVFTGRSGVRVVPLFTPLFTQLLISRLLSSSSNSFHIMPLSPALSVVIHKRHFVMLKHSKTLYKMSAICSPIWAPFNGSKPISAFNKC